MSDEIDNYVESFYDVLCDVIKYDDEGPADFKTLVACLESQKTFYDPTFEEQSAVSRLFYDGLRGVVSDQRDE